MAEQGTSATPAMAALEQGFRGASDAKLKKVTRLIDGMPNRGAADALLAPVRDRLAALRPVRNMNRNRLLFTPFDPVLVPPAHWQPGSFTLPRSIVAPVIALLDGPGGAVLPPPPPFDAADPAELLRCGRPLWDEAASSLERVAIPTGGHVGGMIGTDQGGAALSELIPVMAMVFRSAHALRSLPAPHDPSLESNLLSLLSASIRCGPIGWGVMLTLLLDAAPVELVTRLAGTLARGDRALPFLRTGLDHAVTRLLVQLERLAQPPPGEAPADEPSHLLQRLDTMRRVIGLRELENRPGFERKRIARLEQTFDSASRAMFRQSLRTQLDRFEAMLSNDAGSDVDAASAIETDARRLRAFADGAAVLEGGRHYQSVIDSMTTELADTGTGASAVARLRLMELLGGSERAVQMAATMRMTASPSAETVGRATA